MKKFVSLLFVAFFVFAFVGCQRGKVQDKMPMPQPSEDSVIVPSQTETPEPEAPQAEDNTSVDDEVDDTNESNEPTTEDPPVEDSPQVEDNNDDTTSDDATVESED